MYEPRWWRFADRGALLPGVRQPQVGAIRSSGTHEQVRRKSPDRFFFVSRAPAIGSWHLTRDPDQPANEYKNCGPEPGLDLIETPAGKLRLQNAGPLPY